MRSRLAFVHMPSVNHIFTDLATFPNSLLRLGNWAAAISSGYGVRYAALILERFEGDDQGSWTQSPTVSLVRVGGAFGWACRSPSTSRAGEGQIPRLRLMLEKTAPIRSRE